MRDASCEPPLLLRYFSTEGSQLVRITSVLLVRRRAAGQGEPYLHSTNLPSHNYVKRFEALPRRERLRGLPI